MSPLSTNDAAAPRHGMSLAQALNEGYASQTLDPLKLSRQLEFHPNLHGLTASLADSHPHLFSGTQVFLSDTDRNTIDATVAAIERVAALPGYQRQALAHADLVAQRAFGPKGMFMGYDFHIGAEGPKLIEINTNAGGAFLNAALAQAHHPCCESMSRALSPPSAHTALDPQLVEMFRSEWRSQRGQQPLRTVVIVDDEPTQQYLAPEFELCRLRLMQHGIAAHVADARELTWHGGRLWYQQAAVDMVYNRLTDFYLSEPRHGALRHAYLHNAVVMSPHPRAHALLADKGNLVALSQAGLLRAWGANEADQALLSRVIPHAVRVTPEQADTLWAARRQYFFKPVAGYGSKAAYRGDKLTRRVWTDILAGDFIAQQLATPGERLIQVGDSQHHLKYDVRAYSYDGKVQLLAARTYSGQTTNFRTPGGGFASIVVVPDPAFAHAGVKAGEQPTACAPGCLRRDTPAHSASVPA